MKAALVAGPDEDITTIREMASAARQAGSDDLELWLIGCTRDLPESLPVRLVVAMPGASRMAEQYIPSLLPMLETRRPGLLVFADSLFGNELAAKVAGAVQASCALSVVKTASATGEIHVWRWIYGLNLVGKFALVQHPFVISVARDNFPPCMEGCGAQTIMNKAPSHLPDWLTDYSETEVEQQRDLRSYDVILVGGRGMGGGDAMQKLQQLGNRIGAGVGVTRPVALNGWFPLDRVIGLSGTLVAPKVCLVFGASGCTPFIKGIEKSAKVIAINNDPAAAIFNHCHVGVVEDCVSVMEHLLRLRQGD